jgi:hypothetical protein
MHSSCYRAAAFRIDNRRYWNKEDKIENKLSSWFYLAERSKGILLIDEADIFLERRKHTDLARNRIVSDKCHPTLWIPNCVDIGICTAFLRKFQLDKVLDDDLHIT